MSSAGQPRTLAGRYRLEEVIGRGGMSTVYRATDLSLDREVAVKVAMDPLLERDPVYAARFKREARAAAGLNSPGIVTVFDTGSDGPTRYIVMEYIEGHDLAEILREEPGHRLEPVRAERITEQVADTLAVAHAAGIVHRDIKPGNIMITPQDGVKVLDFGIARTSDGVTLTQTASVLGTAPYMAPEQAMGQAADARSDIYSLGCVLYEMLTGTPPFMGEVAAAVLHQHVRVAPKPPSQRSPGISPALDALVLDMLAKAPEDRPQSAAEVRDRLAALDSATEPTSPLPPPGPVVPIAPRPPTQPFSPPPPIQPAPPTQSAPPTRPVRPAGRRPGRGAGPWVVLAAVAVLLLGAAVAYALTSNGSSNSGSASSSGHSAPPLTYSSTTPPGSTSHSTSYSTTSPTTSSTSSSTTSPTTTTTTITTTTTPSTPGPPTPTPPGQGGVPPGQAKKGKTGKR